MRLLGSGALLCPFVLALGGCSIDLLDKGNDHPASASPYVLEREYQRVIRYDCHSRIVSDQVETVTSPRKMVELPPKSRFHFYSAHYVNLTTGSSPGCLLSNTRFAIDIAPTFCNMRVSEGLNEISYEFYYCDEVQRVTTADGQVSEQCRHQPRLEEQGRIYMNVTYRQETLSGYREIRPTFEECID